MKRFLVTLVVIILAVSVGFGVFYLVKDNEKISLKAQILYKNAGESFEIDLDMENPNSYTTVEISSTDENVVKVESQKVEKKDGVAKGTFTAVSGGNAKIVFKTNNAKFRNLGCDVVVCDGSLAYPYRINNAEELQRIGATDETIYTTDKNYILTTNIDLGELDTPFSPIPNLTGSIDGNGYTISNMTISSDTGANIGFVRTIYAGGVVKNIKFDNAVIEANNENTNIGVIAGISYGKVELSEIKSATITGTSLSAIVGGAVGLNESTNLRTERYVARVDRVSANVTLGTEDAGILGNIGGLVGENIGGTIINSYTTGNAYVDDATLYGGIVAINGYKVMGGTGTGYEGNLGGNIKDCYSIIKTDSINTATMGHILAKNNDLDNVNKIVGNYYESETNLKGIGAKDIIYGETNQNGTTNAVEDNKLRNLAKLVSYDYYEREIQVVDGSIQLVINKASKHTYYWASKVWTNDATINDGYPILTFEDIYIDDNFESSSTMNLIDTYQELNSIRENLSGTHVLSADIDLSEAGEWMPIGTEEKPFTGTVLVADNVANGVTLSNLTITSSGNKYVGLFGVLGNGAYIKGIKLANVKITGNNEFVGAIAGQNNGTIDGCELLSGEIVASSAAGGIVGENKGEICDVRVATLNNDKISITKTYVKNIANYGAGGIAGINHSIITNKDNENRVEGCVHITSNKYTYLGGAVGYNNGTIKNVYVVITGNNDASQKHGVVTDVASVVGGIAGYSNSVIMQVYVSSTLSALSSESNSYVGGIAGICNAKNQLAIQNAVVENSYISGYISAGAVASVNVEYAVKLDVAKKDFNFNGAQYPTNIDDSIDGTIEKVAVENTVTLEGKYSGGLVGHLTKGIVKNCYTKALLSADENAGFVHTISFNSSTGEGGVVFRCYSTASHKQGTSYAVSTSEVHNDWNLGWFVGESSDNRTVGFIFDYYYEEGASLKNPEVPNPFKGFFELIDNQEAVYNCRKTDEMKTKSLWNDILSSSVWSTNDGSLPTIHACEAIKLDK